MVIEASGINIVSIDSSEPLAASRFRLLPGAHDIDVTVGDLIAGRRSEQTLPVCFTGRAGHTYLVRPQYLLDGRWRPQVVDQTVRFPISSDDCSRPAKREVARAVAPAANPGAAPDPAPYPAPAAATVASAPADRGAAPEASPESNAGPPPVAAEPAAPENIQTQAVDREAPVARPSRRAHLGIDAESPRTAPRSDATPPLAFLPRFDIGFETGFFQGGEGLVTATNSDGSMETLGTGDGFLLGISTRVTPLWLAKTAGFGVGGSAGFKVWQVGDSGAQSSIFKWVLTASGHVVFAVDPTWLVVVQGGVEKDSGIDWQINDTSTGVPFQSRIGFMGDLGMQHWLDDQWSVAFSVRVTILDYAVLDQTIGANSFGATLSMHYSYSR